MPVGPEGEHPLLHAANRLRQPELLQYKVTVLFQKSPHDCPVLPFPQGAGGIEQDAARADIARHIVQNRALDGGQILFLLVGGIYHFFTHRRIDQKYLGYINMAGFFCLIALMVVVAVSDVNKLIL